MAAGVRKQYQAIRNTTGPPKFETAGRVEVLTGTADDMKAL